MVGDALRAGLLKPVYQPVLDLQRNELAGFEVLARWRHDTFGSVPPSEFLLILEQAGMLAEFTRHMVVTACTAALGWSGSFWLSFNIEAVQFADHGLPGLLKDAINQTDFPPSRVVIEVTQEAFAADHDHTCLVMGRLAELGVRLALSDVGLRSDMRPLLCAPFSLLKIERDLVRAAGERADALRGVAGVLGLARGLDIPVVATGIETTAQAERIRGLGCDLGQGWLFGEGLPDALASGMIASPPNVLSPMPELEPKPAQVLSCKVVETNACAVAGMLDDLGLAYCLFDDDDRTVLWNRAFLDFFPEHRHQVFRGEPYRENLRRFYEARLHGEERRNIERYIADGVARHRTQFRPYTFHHRGRRLRVVSAPIVGVGRARIWLDESVATEAAPPVKDSWHGPSKVARRFADGYAVLDEDDRVVSVNGEFLRLYGAVAPEQVLGLTLADIVRQAWARHADYRPGEATGWPEGDVVDNARFAGAPFEVRMPGNQWRRVLEHREPNGLGHSIHSDITVLKREQEELRAAREALREQNTELAMLAGTDGLTGVANRRRFGEEWARAWNQATADCTHVALLMIDVDHFKAVNDKFGHPGGDECLRQVADAIGRIVRSPMDLVARYGGEEFAVILPDADPATALGVAERVREGIASSQAATFKVTVSIGCLSVQPETGCEAGPVEMIEQADTALYRAKQNGRNRIEVA